MPLNKDFFSPFNTVITSTASNNLSHNVHFSTVQLHGNPNLAFNPVNSVNQHSNISQISTDIFVGNLSFTVTEENLRTLFSEYVRVQNIRMVRGPAPTIVPSVISQCDCPLYAIVTVSSLNEARELEDLFSQHIFMGRNLR